MEIEILKNSLFWENNWDCGGIFRKSGQLVDLFISCSDLEIAKELQEIYLRFKPQLLGYFSQ